MRNILGYISIVIAVLVGINIGLYFTASGYYDIATSAQQGYMNSIFSNGTFMLGVAKIIFAGTVGFISSIIALIPAWLLLRNEGGGNK
ncbi:hypothetical protein CIL05_07720 [Virgibacillus profundi]|uniref:Uncharacterized protein n=1 Tax=Virgibacillus profundi TaxID=2024555 RepID=A0A2A2IGT1_9BACI|nr:hypothetical protein [Virgibacillus profundi]PAV30350.1 hypothetical protein CIL05_07720 [Virgibacillus profundi]PXY54522.1 hypothetical protein CIT14_07805 [Virgibacillus profundi]